jgi:hypothetical protein
MIGDVHFSHGPAVVNTFQNLRATALPFTKTNSRDIACYYFNGFDISTRTVTGLYFMPRASSVVYHCHCTILREDTPSPTWTDPCEYLNQMHLPLRPGCSHKRAL